MVQPSGVSAQAIGLGGLAGKRERKLPLAGIAGALLTAFCISIYTAIDGAAVKQASPVPYAMALFVLIPIIITPLVLYRHGWPQAAQDFRGNWKRYALMSSLGVLAYALALLAYHLAPVGYAGSIREMSVVFGALAGWQLLGEKLGPWRVVGSMVVFAGIVIIALFG